MKKLHIIFSIILVLFVTAPYCYGSTMTMESGQVTVDVPDGWDVITSDSFSGEAGEYFNLTEDQWPENLGDIGKALLGKKSFKDSDGAARQAAIELSYNPGSLDQDFSNLSVEDDAEDFYDDYGEKIISNVFSGTLLSDLEEPEPSGKPRVINGKWGQFVGIDVSDSENEEANQYRLYYTVKDGVIVSFILTGSGDRLLESQIKDAETMVTSFEDTGYYEDYTGLGDGDIDDEYYDDDSDLMSLLIVPIIGVVVAIAAGILKNMGEPGKNASSARKSTSQTARPSEEKTQQRPVVMAQESTPKRKLPKLQPVKADGKTVTMRSEAGSRKAKNSEESYTDSLKTLLDSGLLTKEEYREMIDKHNRRR